MRVLPINGVGKVAFPDHMSDEEVQGTAQKLHAQANPKGIEDVIQALVKMEKGPSSAAHQKMAVVAKTLEETPGLLQLAIAGLQASSQNGIAPAGQAERPQASQAEPPAEANASGSPT